jgi:hypothetical protein
MTSQSPRRRQTARQGMSVADSARVAALTRLAMAPDHRAVTEPARRARMQQFLDQIPAEVTDPAERVKRAKMLQRAHLIRASAAAARARTAAAEARRLAAEAGLVLDASGLADAGSDGVDADA